MNKTTGESETGINLIKLSHFFVGEKRKILLQQIF